MNGVLVGSVRERKSFSTEAFWKKGERRRRGFTVRHETYIFTPRDRKTRVFTCASNANLNLLNRGVSAKELSLLFPQ